MPRFPTLALLAGLAFAPLAAAPALAQHAGHGSAAPAAAAAPSTAEFNAAAATMHRDMAVPLTGDADRDFAASMIPHHQGAIAMAQVELRHGRDPALRRMAEAIIAAQEKEIAALRAFLAQPR